MFVDASALTAILCGESDAAELLARIENRRDRITSPMAVWETVIAVARNVGLEVRDGHEMVEQFLRMAKIEVVPVSPLAGALAIQAYDRFGKSRHPAALNFGDCFAYACASEAKMPLLFKGDDFSHTDIEAA